MKKDKLLIIDLEATCWMGRPPKGMRQEIIEIGVSILNLDNSEIEGKRSIITIPTNSKINWFCRKLTSIDEKLIKKEGIDFEDACEILKNDYDSKNLVWASWDKFDKSQFVKDCNHKGIDYPLSKKHINLQPLFSKHVGESSKNQFGVKGALKHLNLKFEGNPHRGVDDAYNTARIASNMIETIKEKIDNI